MGKKNYKVRMWMLKKFPGSEEYNPLGSIQTFIPIEFYQSNGKDENSLEMFHVGALRFVTFWAARSDSVDNLKFLFKVDKNYYIYDGEKEKIVAEEKVSKEEITFIQSYEELFKQQYFELKKNYEYIFDVVRQKEESEEDVGESGEENNVG